MFGLRHMLGMRGDGGGSEEEEDRDASGGEGGEYESAVEVEEDDDLNQGSGTASKLREEGEVFVTPQAKGPEELSPTSGNTGSVDYNASVSPGSEGSSGGRWNPLRRRHRPVRRLTTLPLQMARVNARARQKQMEKEAYMKRHSDFSGYSLSNYGEAKGKFNKNPLTKMRFGQFRAPGEREVLLNRPQVHKFKSNHITTSKYNLLTFLPIFLYEMFSRVAYLYFLLQAGLTWWRAVSPFSPFGSNAALIFVLLVSAIKAIIEDSKRHREDHKVNESVAHVVNSDATEKDVKWKHVKVGDVLKVYDDEQFPADLVCLYSALDENVCFIKTVNLDGESNLKIRSPPSIRGVKDVQSALAMRGKVVCEPPNPNLHHFKGKIQLDSSSSTLNGNDESFANTEIPPPDGGSTKVLPISMDEVLLRGCTLKHSGFVIGMVIYTGKETRIMQNASKPPIKVGSFDHFLNIQVAIIIIVQVLLCLACAIVYWFWLEDHRDDYYLAVDNNVSAETVNGIYSTEAAQIGTNFLTFWILFSYLVPISLFVSLEIVKFVQGSVLINMDKRMVDESGQNSLARNSNINEDLGKVEYVFSDKTGTLTTNDMQLRTICFGGKTYGNPKFLIEDSELEGEELLEAFDPDLAAAANFVRNATPEEVAQAQEEENELFDRGMEMLDVFVCLTVCHSLIIEHDCDPENPRYQGPSPDEVALVDAARQLGFVFLTRSADSITLRVLGEEVTYQILNVLEFSSDRQRMSVIAKAPDGTIRLYMKGADSRVQSLLAPDADVGSYERKLRRNSSKFLFDMSVQGLRTLLLAQKVIPEEEYEEWDATFQRAAASIDEREEKLAAAMNAIEQDLLLVGGTAIEDKLQEGVPDAISTLIDAGIKVWMITGDKQETAINIGISCGLVHDRGQLMICNAESTEEAAAQLSPMVDRVEALVNGEEGRAELVIDGMTLSHVLNTESEWTLAELSSQCSSVIVCRASPRQKASIVRLIMGYTVALAKGDSRGLVRKVKRTYKRMQGQLLAIGDGANDVAMIQAADIGVGVFGKEGRQAVNNSDYAIGEFRYLVRLLLVHGTLSHYRLARLIKYSFYKNIAFAIFFFFFQFYAGFSGQALVGSVAAALYNVVLTSLPILFFSVIDKPLSDTAYIVFPQLYNQSKSLSMLIFWKAILLALFHAAVSFFIPFYEVPLSMNRDSINDLYSIGNTGYTCLLIVVNLEIAVVTRYWTRINFVFWFLSVLPVWILFLYVADYALNGFNWGDPQIMGAAEQLCGNANFWFSLLLTSGITFGLRLIERMLKWRLFPDDDMIIAEYEAKTKRNKKLKERQRREGGGTQQSSGCCGRRKKPHVEHSPRNDEEDDL